MCLEADLPAVGPSTAHSGILVEGAEDDVVAGGIGLRKPSTGFEPGARTNQ
jgi:hypothetical protein